MVFVAASVYNIPRFFERAVVLETSCTGGGELRPRVRWTSLRTNPVYVLVYKTVCYFIFRSVGPLVTLIALNSRLAVELRNVDRRRTALRGKQHVAVAAEASNSRQTEQGNGGKQHESLTAMLVGVVTVFIICQLPGLGIRVTYTAWEFSRLSSPTGLWLDVTSLRYANLAINALLVFNSAVNIVVYCLVGKRFRRILLDEMFPSVCSRCRRTSRETAINMTTT